MGKKRIKFDYSGKELSRTFPVGDLKCVVVGTGRCGSVYMAKLLTSAGLPCGHESIFQLDGMAGARARLGGQTEVSLISRLASLDEEKKGRKWFKGDPVLVADSSYMAAPYLDDPVFDNVPIVHLVRNPWPVINGFVLGLDYFSGDVFDKPALKPYHEFIYGHLPVMWSLPSAWDRAAYYYGAWNQLIEEKAAGRRYLLHRIEAPVGPVLEFLGLAAGDYDNREVNHIDRPDGIGSFGDIPTDTARGVLRAAVRKYYPCAILV